MTADEQNIALPLPPAVAYALWAEHYPPYAHNALMRAEERALLGLLPTNIGGRRVLDAGCGSGRYIRHTLQRGASQVLGVDLSTEMLTRAREELKMAGNHWGGETLALAPSQDPKPKAQLIRASLDAIPLPDGWADLTVCGLTLGHLEDLRPALTELFRVTRPGGTLLCSDFHPIGQALDWRREFTAGGQLYTVRHTWHLYSDWHRVSQSLGLKIVTLLEPRLETADLLTSPQLDSAILALPVALVFELRRDA